MKYHVYATNQLTPGGTDGDLKIVNLEAPDPYEAAKKYLDRNSDELNRLHAGKIVVLEHEFPFSCSDGYIHMTIFETFPVTVWTLKPRVRVQ